jgi:hypothetical protein
MITEFEMKNCVTTWLAPRVSKIVCVIGPLVPAVLVYDGPMVIQADPDHTFSCALVVSHQISPVTLIAALGAVADVILLEIGFHMLVSLL